MEGKFTTFVIDELKELINDIEAGRQPRNLVLHTGVVAWLRKQFQDHRPNDYVMEFDGEYSGDICSPEDDVGNDDEPL